MRNILIIISLTILLLVQSTYLYGQTRNILQNKTIKIFSYYKNNKLKAVDSVLNYIPKDKWFTSLSLKDQHFRVLRIQYYKKIVISHPKNQKYLKGWVLISLR